MGSRHAHNLAHLIPHARVSAVMDVAEERARAVAAACGGAAVFNDANRLIESNQVDAVLIASPDSTHSTLALASLAAGKPLLCEKPLANSVDDALAVMQAEIAGDSRLLQLGFMREYDGPHRQVKASVASGVLGAPLYFHGVHANPSTGALRTIDDVIINSAIHDIHSAHWLLGGQVIRVFTQYMPADPLQPQSCRLALLYLSFNNGRMATIELNADAGYGYEVRIEMTCELGAVSTDGREATTVRFAQSSARSVEADWLQRFENAYIVEEQAWIESVRAGVATGPSTWDGYISMAVAAACIESARSGEPVSLKKTQRPALYG
jgi:myo-inositol 2-dehydrogenase/D-chiro-inositol 1-dehydrogenase